MDISIQNLEVSFNNTPILNNVNLQIPKNRFVGIIGPNGSGKSTLLKCIYRALKPNSGIVYLNEKNLQEYSIKDSSKKIGVVAQHSDAGFDFTVQEIAMMGRSPHKKALDRDTPTDYQIVSDALKTVGMENFADRKFATLSGGERQRVILARALAQQTECLILDEPTNHLDIKYQLNLMRIVKETGCTVISAIHDLNIAATYCDELYIMSNGKIYAHGRPQIVLTKEVIWDVYGVHASFIHTDQGVIISFRE